MTVTRPTTRYPLPALRRNRRPAPDAALACLLVSAAGVPIALAGIFAGLGFLIVSVLYAIHYPVAGLSWCGIAIVAVGIRRRARRRRARASVAGCDCMTRQHPWP